MTMAVVEEHEQKARGTRVEFTRYAGPKLRGERTILDFGYEGFPEALMCIPDPPKRLYVIGNPAALGEGIAVVGARKATPYGIACAKRFAGAAAKKRIPIISGGARGCDAAAHRAALEARGTTVAFLGGGCDELYPASHYGLFQEIIDGGGAIVSEQAWNFPPMKFAFRARNRLIAGLAKATLIVEAGLPSGTFSTADEALAANREVLVVPGSIASPTSRGANRLLFQGATPIVDDETFQAVIDALFAQRPAKRSHGSSAAEIQETTDAPSDNDVVRAALLASPMNVDEMLRAGLADTLGALGQPSVTEGVSDALTRLMVRLAELEREGRIMRYPDGRYGPRVV
ncbi:MAG: DNA-processing protein DprA [Raoultibacter sp.]